MKLKYILPLLVSCASTSVYSQEGVRYERRGGLNWIMPAKPGFTFGITPKNKIPNDMCAKVLNFINSSSRRIGACHDGDDVVCTEKIKGFLAQNALKFGFKEGFDGSPGNIPASASVDWRFSGQISAELKPDLLEEYSRRLEIDPRESVVAVMNKPSIKVFGGEELFAIFRPYTKERHGGSSYFFTHVIPLFPGNREAGVYYGPSQRGEDYFRLSSRILNCELQTYPEEYVGIPFNYVMDGRRPVTESEGAEIQSASKKISSGNIPSGASEVQKALLYGFQLARSLSGQTIDKVGMENIVDKVFVTNSGTVSVKTYSSAQELAESLSIVSSYRQEGGYITLVPDMGE